MELLAKYVDNLNSWSKTCKKCNYNFITNSKEELSNFFYKVKNNKDGFKKVCKNCKPITKAKKFKHIENYEVETINEFTARGGQVENLGKTYACHVKLQFSSRHFGPNKRTKGSQPKLKVPIKFSNNLEPVYSEQGNTVASARDNLKEEQD